jgi:hypothetical protein
MVNIEDFTDALVDATDAALGDALAYKPAGGDYAPIRGFVDYGEALRDLGSGAVIDTDITVTVSKRQVAAEPTAAARLVLPKLPGDAFRPFNVRDMGDDWRFAVKRA